MNLFQKNIRLILIAFSIVAFVVFYLLAVKLFNNNNTYFMPVDQSIGLTKGDFIYVDSEKIGRVAGIDTSHYESGQLLAKLSLSKNVNIPDKSYFQFVKMENGSSRQLKLFLIASSGYFNKNDTIPYLKTDAPKAIAEEQLNPIKPEIIDTVKKVTIEKPIAPKNEESVISFKVQFIVSPVEIPLDSKKIKSIKNISHYTDKGLYKYVSGSTKDISESIKYCEEIKKLGFRDAFVVAFRGNERISVKEAMRLMEK